MDKPKITPKDFFLWFGAMAFLYVSIFAFVALIFSYLDYAFPDPLRYYSSDPYASGISYQMASLLVLFPLFLTLMRFIHRSIERDSTRAEVWVRRWALYLVLFVAGVTVAGDLITLLMYFFNGDVTLRFALKVLVILLVAGAGFVHFLSDLRDYWQKNPAQSRLVGYATGLLVIVTIFAGFFIVGTPWQARQYRYDEQRVGDLQNIQSQVVEYWRQKQILPVSLDDLRDSISGNQAPVDPLTGSPYPYQVTAEKSFKLCATFSDEMQPTTQTRAAVTYPKPVSMEGYYTEDLWSHGAGQTCFDRTIDPTRYPPYSTKTAL